MQPDVGLFIPKIHVHKGKQVNSDAFVGLFETVQVGYTLYSVCSRRSRTSIP